MVTSKNLHRNHQAEGLGVEAMDTANLSCGICCEDLLASIMAFLPSKSLFQSRAVSKMWNAIIMDPDFEKHRRCSLGREFVGAAMKDPLFRKCRMESSGGSSLLMVNSDRGLVHISVLQSLRLSLKRLPPLDLKSYGPDLGLKLFFVDMTKMDERTEKFTVCVVSQVLSPLDTESDANPASRRPLETLSDVNQASRRPLQTHSDVNQASRENSSLQPSRVWSLTQARREMRSLQARRAMRSLQASRENSSKQASRENSSIQASRGNSSLQASRGSSSLQTQPDVRQASRKELESRRKMNLHFYDCATKTWSLFGSEGLHLKGSPTEVSVIGLVRHRACYTALLKFMPYIEKQVEVFVYHNESRRWEALPADLPSESELWELWDRNDKQVLFFDHKDGLYIAVATLRGCLLWKYDDDTSRWVLILAFESEVKVKDYETVGELKIVREPYAQVLGDFLHFAVFVPVTTTDLGTLSQRMTYNLVTGELRKFSIDEARTTVLTENVSRKKFLVQFG